MDKPAKITKSFVSLRIGLGGAFVAVVVVTALLLGLTMFFDVRAFVRNDVRDRLRNAIGVAALEIDAASHSRIKAPSDESSAAYRGIKEQLQDIRARSKDVRFVYTLRKNASGQITFVVDAEDNAKDMSHVGDVYKTPTAAMLAVFEPPYKPRVEKAFTIDQWGSYLSGYAPLLSKDGRLEGAVGMDISAANVLAYEDRFLRLGAEVFLAIFLVVALLGFLLARRISQPLLDLAGEMGRIQNFDLDDGKPTTSRVREVMMMSTSLDNMRKGLRSFKRYVPSDLVSELIQLDKEAVLGAEKRELTVFFSDIADFTTISERLPIEKLAESLGGYFERMTRAVLANGGTVDKFIGDAIMAFWGAPRPNEDHALQACRAALACQKAIEDLKSPSFVTRIGINTGEAFVGNFGFKDRLSYTAMGDTVNLASRLEALNKQYGTRILISESTFARVRRDFAARPIDCVAVKGKAKGVTVYELIAARADLSTAAKEQLELYIAGMDLYRMRRWVEAEKVFAKLCEKRTIVTAGGPTGKSLTTTFVADRPSEILRARCRDFLKTPPPRDWNGVTVLHEK